jgi:hypothetical protein
MEATTRHGWARSAASRVSAVARCLVYRRWEISLSYLRVGDLYLLWALRTVGDDDLGLAGANRPYDRLRHVAWAVRGEPTAPFPITPARNLSWNSVAVTKGRYILIGGRCAQLTRNPRVHSL